MDQARPVPKPRPRPRTSLRRKEDGSTNTIIKEIPTTVLNEVNNETEYSNGHSFPSQNENYASNSILYESLNQQLNLNSESIYAPAKEVEITVPPVPRRRVTSQVFDLMPGKIVELRKDLLTLILENAAQSKIKEIVMKILEFDGDFNDKYDVLHFKDLIKKNEETSTKKIITALSILSKYASNLLKEEDKRPPAWSRINFSSKGYQNVIPFLGNGQILKDIGYTVPFKNIQGETDGLAFEQNKKPNRKKVQSLSLDLCIARYEMEEISSGKHPQLKKLKEVDGIPNVFFLKTDSMGEIGIQNANINKTQPTHALLLSKPSSESEIVKCYAGPSNETEIRLYKNAPPSTENGKLCENCKKEYVSGVFCTDCGVRLVEKKSLSNVSRKPNTSTDRDEERILNHATPSVPKSYLDVQNKTTPNIYQKVSPENSPEVLRKPLPPKDDVSRKTVSATSTESWECKHCTFLNSADIQICEVCLKTSWTLKPTVQSTEDKKGDEISMKPEVKLEPEIPVSPVNNDVKQASATELNTKSNTPVPSTPDRQNSETAGKDGFMSSIIKGLKNMTTKKDDSEPTAFKAGSEVDIEMNMHDIGTFVVVEEKQSDQQKISKNPPLRKSVSDKEKISEIFLQKEKEKQIEEQEKQKQRVLEKERRQNEQKETEKIIKLFKTAEKNGFSVDECNVGILHLGDAVNERNIINWLNISWKNFITETTNLCNQKLNKTKEKQYGLVPEELVKKYLIKLRGNQKEVVDEVAKIREHQYVKLQKQYQRLFERDVLIRVLTESKGSLKESRKKLDGILLKDFKERSKLAYDEKKIFEMIGNPEVPNDIKCLILLGEGYVQSWGVGENICKLMKMDEFENAEVIDFIEAGKSSLMLERCKKYLKHTCIACYSDFPVSKILLSTGCGCELCQDCFVQSLKVSIETDDIDNLKCRFCQTDVVFAHLEFQIKHYVKEGLMEKKCLDIFNTKLLDKNIAFDPNFRYCLHCNNGYGFLWFDSNVKMRCDKCHGYSCFNCKKKWTDEHEDLTCEQYEQFLFLNEDKGDEKNVAAIFDRTQIDCPSCKAQFELARGGCMHFTCQKCKFQFCGGCSQQFADSKKNETTPNCSERCAKSGFHTHHPRDCFYYLRDFEVAQLQELLKKNEIPYETEVTDDRKDQAIVCNVNEVKEERVEVDGKVTFRHYDEYCGAETENGHAGLCKKHYKEYLGILINRYGLDPVEISSVHEIGMIYNRVQKEKPDLEDGESEEDYQERLIEACKKDVLLPKRKTMLHPKQVAEMRERMKREEEEANISESSLESD